MPLDFYAFDEGSPTKLKELLDAGFDAKSEEARDLALEAVKFDERTAYSESGRERAGRVGGALRSAQVLALLIEAGYPEPAQLLVEVRWPEQAKVLLAANPTQLQIDAGLRAQLVEHSFDPNVEVVKLLLAAKPSQSALDAGLLSSAKGAAAYRGVPVDFTFYDVFDAFLEAGARPDRPGANASTALHVLVGLSPPGVKGGSSPERRNARAVATFARALQDVKNVDVVDQHGQTPLHVAASTGAYDRIPLLLARGANPAARTTAGAVPSDLAFNNDGVYAALGVVKPPPPPPRGRKLAPVKAPPPPAALDPLRVGVRVRHAKFGSGEVTALEGQGDKRKLTIRFDSDETKVMAASFVTLL